MRSVFLGSVHFFQNFSCVPIWAEPHFIRTVAHALSGRRLDADFVEWFLPQYLRGSGKNNLNEIAESSPEFLFNLFVEVWNTLGQTVKIPSGNRKHQVCNIFVGIYVVFT